MISAVIRGDKRCDKRCDKWGEMSRDKKGDERR